MNDLPERLRDMAQEWDDPMCSPHPVCELLTEAASEIERLRYIEIRAAAWGILGAKS